MYTLYGIKNCDTVKKARKWLEDNHIDYQFHDFRDNGLDTALLEHFDSALGYDKMLNRRSTSWRQLSEEQKKSPNKQKAFQLMLATPTLIKRPILDTGEKIILGFASDNYKKEL